MTYIIFTVAYASSCFVKVFICGRVNEVCEVCVILLIANSVTSLVVTFVVIFISIPWHDTLANVLLEVIFHALKQPFVLFIRISLAGRLTSAQSSHPLGHHCHVNPLDLRALLGYLEHLDGSVKSL